MSNPICVKGIRVETTTSPDYHYGLDVESKLSQILSEEFAKSIDAQILQTIINQGRPMMRSDKIKSILNRIKSSE